MVIASLVLAAAVTPSPEPTATSANEVVARVGRSWSDLKSYQVPVTISGSVKVSIISVPFVMHGTEYFRAPDQESLHIYDAPKMAQGLGNTIGSMGTPLTWPYTYDLSLTRLEKHGKHVAYVLTGVPHKSGSNVKSVTMWIGTQSNAVESMLFSYNNGATLSVDFAHHHMNARHLPSTAGVGAHFPAYSGSATIQYGTYQINVAIPDSAFAKQ